jgi:hypothetical protein
MNIYFTPYILVGTRDLWSLWGTPAFVFKNVIAWVGPSVNGGKNNNNNNKTLVLTLGSPPDKGGKKNP